MTTLTRQEQVTAQRERYMTHEIAFQEYYLWLADLIGATRRHVPFTTDTLKQSYAKDEHFNTALTPLGQWDAQHPTVRSMAHGISWALSDTVCVLKALAQQAVTENA